MLQNRNKRSFKTLFQKLVFFSLLQTLILLLLKHKCPDKRKEKASPFFPGPQRIKHTSNRKKDKAKKKRKKRTFFSVKRQVKLFLENKCFGFFFTLFQRYFTHFVLTHNKMLPTPNFFFHSCTNLFSVNKKKTKNSFVWVCVLFCVF